MKLLSVRERLSEIRSSSRYRSWHKEVIERDNGKCVLCGSDKNIEVDHIKSLALYPHLATVLSNGRVLCGDCHKKTDTYGIYSTFKNESEIHPVLRGDLLFKLQSLPLSIEIDKDRCLVGLSIAYDVKLKQWRAGYRRSSKSKNLFVLENGIEEAVDSLMEKLKKL